MAHDRRADSRFVYAVRSTGVYCRPSCGSRRPRRELVSFFDTPADAERAGFRACRRCRPGEKDPWIDKIHRACVYLANVDGHPSLATLAKRVGGSPYHLQRNFKRLVGIAPREYAEAVRLRKVKTRLRRGEAVLALLSLAFLLVVLGGVAAGYFYAVEAAAMGAFVLFSAGIVTGRLRGQGLRDLLHETLAITGALFGLLAAATTLTLIFRAFGTDRLLDQWIVALPGGEIAVTLVVLGTIGLCAFVLDAFEIIFVLVPILIPPLLVRVPDAVWVSTLVLLTLQASFLLPPFGYALMMARTALRESLPIHTIARAVAPFLVAQLVVLALVLAFPALVHLRDTPGANTRTLSVPVSDEEVERRLQEMLAPPAEDRSPASP